MPKRVDASSILHLEIKYVSFYDSNDKLIYTAEVNQSEFLGSTDNMQVSMDIANVTEISEEDQND